MCQVNVYIGFSNRHTEHTMVWTSVEEARVLEIKTPFHE